ncbi:MAG TPA: MFS transporter [Rhodocyclaceae bacterium]
MSSTLHLLKVRRFAPLFVTQFFGAFNDNVFKNALVVLLTFKAANWSDLAPAVLANLAAGLFILPFFLFSASAGQWADKTDKARMARLTKLLEVLIVLVAGLGFWLQNLPLLFIALFLLGAQSALFGPVKYAVLPQHLRADELLGGNALIEAATFVSILLGTILGGVLAALDQGTLWITATSLLVAVVGLVASLAIPPAPPPAPELVINRNPLAETWRTVAALPAQAAVFTAVLGISWFWLYGALLLAQFPAFGRYVLGGDEGVVTLMLAVFTVGIGVGSMACAQLSRGRLSLRWVGPGALGITVATLDLAWAAAHFPLGETLRPVVAWLGSGASWRILADLLVIGSAGGLFIVPLYTQLQLRAEEKSRARAIAANNIVNALFMVVGALVAGALLGGGLSIPALFAGAALLNLAALLLLYRRDPAFVAAWRNARDR